MAEAKLFDAKFFWDRDTQKPLSAHAENDSKIIDQKDLTAIEEKVQTELKSSTLSEDKKFLINIIAGRELYQYRFYDKAKTYYENALKINTAENKTEALVNLIAIAINKKDKEKVKMLYEEAQKYYAKNSAFKGSEIDYYLNTVERRRFSGPWPMATRRPESAPCRSMKDWIPVPSF